MKPEGEAQATVSGTESDRAAGLPVRVEQAARGGPGGAGGIASISGTSIAWVTVYVAGEVRRPGVYRLPAGERIQAALHAAGGAKADADMVAVNLAEPLRDGEEVAVPVSGAEERTAKHTTSRLRGARGRSSSYGSRKREKEPPAPVDINTADVSELRTLPGVGESLAERIVAYRELNGPFQAIEDLRDVAGVSDARLDRLVAFVTLR